MKSLLNRVWREDEGVLTFEWILLITLLVIGVVGGISAVRDAILTELGDLATAIVLVDQSYAVQGPWEVAVSTIIPDGGVGWRFTDGFNIDEEQVVTTNAVGVQSNNSGAFGSNIPSFEMSEPN